MLFRISTPALCCLLAGVGLPVAAAEKESVDKVAGSADEPVGQFSRIWQWGGEQLRDFTKILLPETQERQTWRLSLSPRLGDLTHHDHVRLPVSLIYGFNRRTDGEVEVDYYFPNPFEDSTGSGIANYRFNGKYRWRRPTEDVDHLEIATGLRMVRPVPSSPAEFNQGVNRYSVYTTMSRPLPQFQDVEGFMTVSYEIITPSDALGFIPEEEPQDDFVEVVTGFVRQREKYQYGLSLGWACEVEGPGHNFFTVTPSVLYDIPPRYLFNSPGRWQLGLAVEGKRYGSENDVSLRVRGRWVIDFRRAWRAITGNGDASTVEE